MDFLPIFSFWPTPSKKGTSSEVEDNKSVCEPASDCTEHLSYAEAEVVMDIVPVIEGSVVTTGATIAQLIAKAIPDADIHCSNVIIAGSQSAGKTKMIISMVFHHLVDNETFTDEMGTKLLKLFRTGDERMVTRRPMTINLVKTAPGSACQIWLSFKGKIATFAETTEFDKIIADMQRESLDCDHQAYAGELGVTISAPGLPRVRFTDLPGLTAGDRSVADEEGGTIRKLVEKYLKLHDTTLVVVEPASTTDFATSLAAHLMSVVHGGARADVFSNAVLVLSKCDAIRQGHEGKLMSLINGTSDQLQMFPFKHVVGVVNKISDRSAGSDEQPSTFAEFRDLFRKTKEFEQKIFSEFHGPGGLTCDPLEHYSTAAVFSKIDQITFRQVHRSIGKGLEVLSAKVKQTKAQIRRECAPPLVYYDQAAPMRVGEPRGRALLLEESRDALLRAVVDKSKLLKIDDSVCQEVADKWPPIFSWGDLSISLQQEAALDQISSRLTYFLEGVVLPSVSDELSAPVPSSFHRMDRFPKLVAARYDALMKILPDCRTAAKAAVEDYLKRFWDYDVPKGVTRDQIPALLEQLKHVALRKMFEQLRALSKGEAFDAIVRDDSILEEATDFAENRSRLRERWENLHRQEAILERCKAVNSNEELRATLVEAYEAQQGVQYTSDEDWMQFWHDSESNFVPLGQAIPSQAPATDAPAAKKRKRSAAAEGTASQSAGSMTQAAHEYDFMPVSGETDRSSPTQSIMASAESPLTRPKFERTLWQPNEQVLGAIGAFARHFESTGIHLTKTSPIPKSLEGPLREVDKTVLSHMRLTLINRTFGYYEALQEAMGGEVTARKISDLLTRLRLRDKSALALQAVEIQTKLLSEELARAVVRFDDVSSFWEQDLTVQSSAVQPAWVCQWAEHSKKRLRDLVQSAKQWVKLENTYREKLTMHDRETLPAQEVIPLDADEVAMTYISRIAAALPESCLYRDLEYFQTILFEGQIAGDDIVMNECDEPTEEVKEDIGFD